MAYNEDSSASGHDEPWIQWFCGLKGHEMFCEVERSYIEDGFNLYGLRACVSNFSDCLDLILDRIGPDDSDDSHLTQNACTLYGLIHARYIITAHGLDAMYNKYAAKEFGTCPLVQCAGQPVLPVGPKDEIGADTVKIFCPKCQCVYHPPPVRSRSNHHGSAGMGGSGGGGGVDGASFGTTFPHLFLMTFSNLVPDPLPVDSAYIPRVFGFRVHPSARQRNAGSSTSPTQAVLASNRRADGGVGDAMEQAMHSRRGNGVADLGTAASLTRNENPSRSRQAEPDDDDDDDDDGKPPLTIPGQSSLPPQDALLASEGDAGGKEKSSSKGQGSASGKKKVVRTPLGDGDGDDMSQDGEVDIGNSIQSKRRNDLVEDGENAKRDSENGLMETSSKRRKRQDNFA